jgi:hypothetical protein
VRAKMSAMGVIAKASRLARNTSDSPQQIAIQALSDAHDSAIRDLAMSYLVDRVGMLRRADARQVEAGASAEPAPEESSAAERGQARERARYAEKRQEKETYGHVLSSDERIQIASEQIDEAIESFRASMRLELTAELLASEFSLGDGSSVTWGAATVEQHSQRVASLTRHAVGTAETAARHSAAIALCEENGVQSLDQISRSAPRRRKTRDRATR